MTNILKINFCLFIVAIGDWCASLNQSQIKVYSSENLSLLTTFKAHSNMINQIKQSPFNSDYVATVSFDFTARIWNITNVSNLNLIRDYTGHNGVVNDLEFINQYLIATGSYSLHIWYLSTGILNRTINTYNTVSSLKLLCNGIHLAAGLFNGLINIYNINTGNLLSSLPGHNLTVTNLALLSPYLMAGLSDDWTVRIWDLNSNTTKFILTGHKDLVRGAKLLSIDLLATGSIDKTVKLWNITDGTLLKNLTHGDKISWSVDMFDAQQLVSGSADTTITIWNFNRGQIQNKITTGLCIRSLAVLNANITETSKI